MAGTGRNADGYAQCPGCLTVFRVEAGTLAVAAGRVRCGLCGEGFVATARYRAELPPGVPVDPPAPAVGMTPGPMAASAKAEVPPETPRGDAPGAPEAAVASGDERSGEASTSTPEVGPAGPAIGSDWRTATAAALETEPHAPVPRGSARVLAWGAGCLVLVAALAAQLGWAWRHELARHPAWRPWVAAVCEHAPCDLVPARVPGAVVILRRAIRPHPEVTNALRLTATLVSRAEHPQPWPQLGLRLFALNGQPVASHWFAPADYRSGAGADGLMQPARRYRIAVGFIDPGTRAESFEIAFR